MSRFAWVVVLAPIQGCGGEAREEGKGKKREEGMGEGCSFCASVATVQDSRKLFISKHLLVIFLISVYNTTCK